MGTACCVKVSEALSTSDCILFWQTIVIAVQTLFVGIGIGVSAGVGIWIIRTLQEKLTNQRVLKDHLIQEVKDLRNEYRVFFKEIHCDNIIGNQTIPWFQLMSIKTADVLKIASAKYGIDLEALAPYSDELPDLVTSNEEFGGQFRSGLKIYFSDKSKNSFVIFEQKHNHLFNDIITAINDGP